MNADTFLRAATDPAAWLRKSVSLRRCGDALWDRFLYGMKAFAESGDKSGFDYLEAAQMFYGLALEAAFKARILREQPEKIEFSLSADGTGAIQFARMERFGTSIKDGHNLVALAELAGALNRGEGAIFTEEFAFRAFREILMHLSDAIRWSVRYPVPTTSDSVHEKPRDIPARIFGHYIRDWIDPALDALQAQTPSLLL